MSRVGNNPGYVNFQETVNNLDAQGKANLASAGAHGQEALNNVGEAAANAGGFWVNVFSSIADAGRSVGHAAAGVGSAIAGGVGFVVERTGDLIGAGFQRLGAGLVGAGNEMRDVAGLGGTQYTLSTIEGDKFAQSWSNTMLNASGEQFALSARSLEGSLVHAAGAGVNAVRVATNLAEAAGHTLAAAKDLGDAAVIEVAEKAVLAAQAAVRAAQDGVDTAGALMQGAGKALITAGNAVNTARGNDTAVQAHN